MSVEPAYPPKTTESPSVAGREPICWVVTDGKVGMEAQCLGLAEAMGLKIVVKRIRNRVPWRWLPPAFWPMPLAAPGPKGDGLGPPWPDLVIGCGRQSVAPVAAMRAVSGCLAVQLQDPKLRLDRFDLVVVAAHDKPRGPNVIATLGAMNRIRTESLRAAAERFASTLDAVPRPRVAVLLGGNNKVYRLTPDFGSALGRRLANCLDHGHGLMITPSRRTPPDLLAALRAELPGEALESGRARIWDEASENPYFGYMALADHVVVTADSVNMVSESCATGMPVHVAHPPGGGRKFAEFHRAMEAAGLTRPLDLDPADRPLESWDYEPLRETERVAAAIRERLSARGIVLPR